MTDESDNIVLDCENPEAEAFGPIEARLGVVSSANEVISLGWDEAITETPKINEVEIWELYNFTMDAHPIHVHQIHFEVVNRQALARNSEEEVILPPQLAGAPIPPEAWEMGYKDTVIALPGKVTRIKVRFDIPGLFVWHCRILEHEDNEKMRPFRVDVKSHIPAIFIQPPIPPVP